MKKEEEMWRGRKEGEEERSGRETNRQTETQKEQMIFG